MNKSKLSQLVRLLTCFLMLSSVAVLRDARFMGHDIAHSTTESEELPVEKQSDGSIVVSTKSITSDVMGYGGPTPLVITIKDGRIAEIQAQKNAETPDFFSMVESELLPKWKGKTMEEAVTAKVDGVSGATLSSNAVNATIRRAMQTVVSLPIAQDDEQSSLVSFKSAKWVLTLLVVLMGAVVPLFFKNKRYRTLQLCSNVIVLGLWSGTFLSYSMIVNYLSNGMNVLQSLVPLLLLVTAFVYPLFGKQRHYCMWVCPLGSLQELVGKCVKKKWTLSASTLNKLRKFNEALWVILMLLMWSGVCFSWMDYELFSAFLLSSASVYVIAVAVLFMVLSLFIQRPYCRFVCPTGCLFRITQNSK